MSDPYRPANPNDPILAETWNQMQRDIRDHILSHTHTGGSNAGAVLTGDSIDKASTLQVEKVTVASSLSVKGIDVGPRLEALGAEKLNAAGGTVSGALTVSGTLTAAGKLDVSKDLSVTGGLSVGGALSVSGSLSGPPSDYVKAQFTLSGGGIVTWANKRLKWTTRFIAISMERPTSFASGHVNVDMPRGNLPAVSVYDRNARSVNAEGIALNPWEALWAVHSTGEDQTVVELRITSFTQPNFTVPSNWILVAVYNGDDSTLKLGTGETLNAGGRLLRSALSADGTGLKITGNVALPKDASIRFADNGEIGSLDANHRILFRRTEDLLEIRESGNIILSAGATKGEATNTVVVTPNGLKIGSNFAMSSPDQAIRMVWGFVNSSAEVVAGRGFTVKKDGDGFRVTFSTAFAARPCVLATQHWNGDVRDNAVVYDIWEQYCLIKTGDSAGKPEHRHFCFIAIGP